jgi:hypothetical protein
MQTPMYANQGGSLSRILPSESVGRTLLVGIRKNTGPAPRQGRSPRSKASELRSHLNAKQKRGWKLIHGGPQETSSGKDVESNRPRIEYSFPIGLIKILGIFARHGKLEPCSLQLCSWVAAVICNQDRIVVSSSYPSFVQLREKIVEL